MNDKKELSKEAIRIKYLLYADEVGMVEETNKWKIESAMEDWGKQQCIAFKNWCEQNEINEDYAHGETLTTEQLYFYFTEQNK